MTSPAVSYRQMPAQLTTAEIVSEILWIADAVDWPGAVGRWARQRRDALRRELQSRGAS